MKKLLFSAVLAFALIAAQAGIVFAQDTTTSNTGTVTKIEIKTDATTGDTTVLVTYQDAAGATQTVRISVATAELLGLVTTTTTTDPATGMTTTVTTAIDGVTGTEVTIYTDTVIPDPTTTEEAQHPVGAALYDFFAKDLFGLDVSYETIMSYHNGDNADAEGSHVGFGVIAQALWMTSGDDSPITFDQLMQAKIDNNYTFTLADGSEVIYRNWGDVKNSLGKKGNNLGTVMSGKDKNSDGTSTDAVEAPGNGRGNSDKGNNKEKGNGKGNGNSHGGGRP